MSETAIISVHVQAFHSDVVEQEWKAFSSGYTQLILYRKLNFFRIVGRNVEEGNFVINTRISPNYSIYEKITETFHQYSDDGQEILGFNFYSQDHANEFFTALENAMEEAESYQSKRCSEASPENRTNNDVVKKESFNIEEGTFAEILKSVKLNKTNNTPSPAIQDNEQESDLVSEIQKKLNRRKNAQEEEFVDPLAKKESTPKETLFDFRSHLKHTDPTVVIKKEKVVSAQSDSAVDSSNSRSASAQALEDVKESKEKKLYEEPPNFDKVNEFKSIANQFERDSAIVNSKVAGQPMGILRGSETDLHSQKTRSSLPPDYAALKDEIMDFIKSELEKTKVEIINEVRQLLKSTE